MDFYELIKALIAILIGWIILLSLQDRDKRTPKGLSYAMAKYGGIGLIFYGILYIYLPVYNSYRI